MKYFTALSVSIPDHPPINPSVCLSVSIPDYPPIRLPIRLSFLSADYLTVCLLIGPSVCLTVDMSTMFVSLLLSLPNCMPVFVSLFFLFTI